MHQYLPFSTIKFPLLISGGLIEAFENRNNAFYESTFPLLISGGLIEADDFQEYESYLSVISAAN